jgi:hypothetical protein
MSTSACIFGPPGGRCARVSPARNRPRTIRSYRARHLHRCRWLSGQRGGLSRGGPLRAQGYCQLYKSRLGVYPLSGVCKSSNPESWPLLGIRTFENRSNHPYLPLVFEIPPVKLTVPLERPLVIPFLGSFAESPAAEVVLHMPKWAPRLSVKGSVPVHTTPMQYGGIGTKPRCSRSSEPPSGTNRFVDTTLTEPQVTPHPHGKRQMLRVSVEPICEALQPCSGFLDGKETIGVGLRTLRCFSDAARGPSPRRSSNARMRRATRPVTRLTSASSGGGRT